MDQGKILIKDYSYSLPEDRIAKYPLAKRDASKLLIYQHGKISESLFKNIADHIPADSLLIYNNTKVVEARLLFQKQTGAVIEVFCLEPHSSYKDISSALQQQEKVLWQCFIGGASKWKHGQVLEKEIKLVDKTISLRASYQEKSRDSFIIEFSWTPTHLSFAEILHFVGAIPLPPYIKRKAELSDSERYQTVYAHFDGSVAAPTAGLHFTKNIFEALKKKKIKTDFVTLHVGAGTFKPVKAETINEHEMHSEFIEVERDVIENILKNLENNIIAVGTTSLRTIESLYWLGVKTILNNSIDLSQLTLPQWEPYNLETKNISVNKALESLIGWMDRNNLIVLRTKTQIIIAPGYKIKIAKALITNFHQPQSTLLLLIAALIGDDWKKAYDYALKNNFRFLSYGDSSLLWVNEPMQKQQLF